MTEHRTLRLTLAYDGTQYVGWQIQPNGHSVQEAVERAIEKLTGCPATIMSAGRTDSGVHALGQVASFRTVSRIPCGQFRRGLQNFLPDDILVRDVAEVAEDFHATYSARFKRYRYVIRNDRVRDPFLRRYVWQYHAPLETVLMHQAAQHLVGTHDFRSFESHWPNKATSIRTVYEVAVTRQRGWPVWNVQLPGDDHGSEEQSQSTAVADGLSPADVTQAPFVCVDIVADGFLYNMVRAITGSLVKVGLGRWSSEDFRKMLLAQDRNHAGETAPPQGLYLVHVSYEPHPEQRPSQE